MEIVLIKADWCGYCKEFIPEFIKLKNKMKNEKINFHIIDANDVKNYSILPKIKKYPTILFYNKNKLLGEYTQDRKLLEKYIKNFFIK